MAARPPKYADIVRANWPKTLGAIVASSPAALAMQKRSISHVQRKLRGVAPEDLAGLDLGGSWLVAVVLGPGDDTRKVASWASGLANEQQPRVRFYLLRGVKAADAFRAWYDAGLPDPLTSEVENWTTFHKRFGNELNNQIYRDATSP